MTARSLTRRFASVRAASQVSFDVRRGEMFGLIGPDGAGKTTTLRMLLGLLKPDSGQALTCGLDPARERRRLSSRVGYLSQKFSLYGDLTVDENVAFFAEIHDVRDYAARRDALLEMVRMTPFRDRLADRLSGGMKQKLALVCTLVHTPELLVLDEPTTGVDPVSRRDFWKLLARLQREGLTLLLTTPYLDEAERCTRVALIDRGSVLTVDSPDALRAAERGVMVEVVAEPAARGRSRSSGRRRASREVEVFGERLHASLPDEAPAGAAAAAEALAARLRGAGLVRPLGPARHPVARGRVHRPHPRPRGDRGRRRGDPMRRALLLPLLLPVALAAAQETPRSGVARGRCRPADRGRGRRAGHRGLAAPPPALRPRDGRRGAGPRRPRGALAAGGRRGRLHPALRGAGARHLRPHQRPGAAGRAHRGVPEHPGQLARAGRRGAAALHRRPHRRADHGRGAGPLGRGGGPPGRAGRPRPRDEERLLVARHRAREPAGRPGGDPRLRRAPPGRPQPRALRHGGAQRGAGRRGRARPRRAREPARGGGRGRRRGEPAAPARPAPRHAGRAERAARGPRRRPAADRGPGGRGPGRARRAQGPRRARGRRRRRRRGGARDSPAPGRAHRRLHLLEPQPGHRASRPPTGRTRGTWG